MNTSFSGRASSSIHWSNSTAMRDKPGSLRLLAAVLLALGALMIPGTASADVITFTQSHWTPGANPFQTPINPLQMWSFNLSSFVQAHPDAEIESATLTIDAWDFDTAASAVNTVFGTPSSGFIYDTYFTSNYDYMNHQGYLFDPASLNDVVNVEGNGAHVLSYPHGGPDGGLVLELDPGAGFSFSYLWDGDLDVNLDFNEIAGWSMNTWYLTHPDPDGNPWMVTDMHVDHIASSQPGTFGLGNAVLTVNYVVPEPATMSLLAIGLAGLICRRFRVAR